MASATATVGNVCVTELNIIKEAQREEFKEEIIALTARKELSKRSHLLPLTPMLDGGLLRSNTRLRRSDDLAADTKFPIILPKKHHVTQLIVKYHHEMERHEEAFSTPPWQATNGSVAAVSLTDDLQTEARDSHRQN